AAEATRDEGLEALVSEVGASRQDEVERRAGAAERREDRRAQQRAEIGGRDDGEPARQAREPASMHDVGPRGVRARADDVRLEPDAPRQLERGRLLREDRVGAALDDEAVVGALRAEHAADVIARLEDGDLEL